jgi:hypothetical protein
MDAREKIITNGKCLAIDLSRDGIDIFNFLSVDNVIKNDQ